MLTGFVVNAAVPSVVIPVEAPTSEAAYRDAVAQVARDGANAVLVGEWSGEPLELLELAHGAEQEWCRTREIRWGPRTLDVDILVVGELVSDDPILTLPHPRARERAFVLVPWAEADPRATLPDGSRVVDLAAGLAPEDDVRRRDDLALVLPS